MIEHLTDPVRDVHRDLDPMVLVVTAGVLVLILLWQWLEQHVPMWREERRLARLSRAALAYVAGAHHGLIAVDHTRCSADDCNAVICLCSQPAECSWATTLGCDHEGLCWEHRLRCRECSWVEHTAAALDWAAGR